MKRINSIILAGVALLACSATVGAQDYTTIDGFIKYKYGSTATITFPRENGVHVDEEKSFGYSKNVSSPFNDGTYWIKLETFATGSAQKLDKPSDIVLVLDFSNSMALGYPEDRTNDALFRSRGVQNYTGGGGNNINSNVYYYKFEGKYYQVAFGGNAYQQGRHMYFTTDDGVVYYLNNYGNTSQPGISTTLPTQPQTNNVTYWRGELYEYTGTRTRLSALKDAVEDFIKVIYHNDNYADNTNDRPRGTPLGNRVSVISFSGDSDSSTGAHVIGTNQTGQPQGWHTVSTASGAVNYTALVNSVRSETNHPSTISNRGMKLANTLLSRIDSADPDRKANSNRTVLFFTDGVPGGQWVWDDTGCLPTANACIGEAKTTKETYGATVFSVALWQGGFVTYGGQQMLKYLNYTSSNYPNASNMTTPGTPVDEEERIYMMEAGDDLSAVFKAIAHMSGGSSTNLGGATSNVDVVSNSFILPSGTTSANIGERVRVFTAPLTAINDSGEYIFGTETLAGKATDTYDVYDAQGNVIATYKVDEVQDPAYPTDHTKTLPIKVDLVGTNTIKVTNFDYSNNWCGPIEDQAHQITYHGHKVIILIPIQMNPTAVGGPNVETNEEGSGIITSDGPYITFTSPKVSLPVNIHIEKTGLKSKESARFLIERAVIPDSGNYDEIQEWEYVTTVFVTNSEHAKLSDDSNPIVKVRGLAANKSETEGYVYRVTEENWSWSYTGATPPQYTDTQHITNPFTFENTPITSPTDVRSTIKHAESKVKNKFNSSTGTKEYDDSKTNTD